MEIVSEAQLAGHPIACAQTKLNSGTNQSLVIVCTQASHPIA